MVDQQLRIFLFLFFAFFYAPNARSGVIVVATTNSASLKASLHAQGLTITSASVVNGHLQQFGIYTAFTNPPVAIADGVVLSSGNVLFMGPPADPNLTFPEPDWEMSGTGTPEFDAYGPGPIENFFGSYDVAVLRVDFHLETNSPIRFDFIFGSVEYPHWTDDYTDAFLVFLDGVGPTNQIAYDKNQNPIQVGKSFAGSVITNDVNTAFAFPHGMTEKLTTTSASLAPGDHTLWFEVGDVSDDLLDSAAFITNLRAESGGPGTEPAVEIPRLMVGGIQKLGITNVIMLQWTNNGVAVTVEQSANVTDSWNEVNSLRSTNSGLISTTVTNSAAAQFFRLRKN